MTTLAAHSRHHIRSAFHRAFAVIALALCAISTPSFANTIDRNATHACSGSEATDKDKLYACRTEGVRCSGGKLYCCTGSSCVETAPQAAKNAAAATAGAIRAGSPTMAITLPPQALGPRPVASAIHAPPKQMK